MNTNIRDQYAGIRAKSDFFLFPMSPIFLMIVKGNRMTSTNMNWRSWVTIALCSFLVMWSGQLFAEESKGTAPEISNIGFIKQPSAALRERFPMCDAFVKVEWFDKEKLIGYSHYEAIVKNKKNQYKSERKPFWAIVNLKYGPGIDYDVYPYWREGRLNDALEALSNGVGSPFAVAPMKIKYKGETFVFPFVEAKRDDADHPLLSDNLQTVCVPYPDEQRAWIVESRTVGQSYREAEIGELTKQLGNVYGQPIPKDNAKKFWILDLNWDGEGDFIGRRAVFYTISGQLHVSSWKYEHPYHVFTFPPENRVCRVRQSQLPFILTTDGKNYFRNGCNLTELTSQAGEE